MNTFKIRRADYNEIWEISFLLYVLPLFDEFLELFKTFVRKKYFLKRSKNFIVE